MPTGIYIDSLSKKIKDFYVEVGGVPKKVIKGYVEVGGQPKLFWDGGGIPIFRDGSFQNTKSSSPLSNTSIMNSIQGTTQHEPFSINWWRDTFSRCISSSAAWSASDGSYTSTTLIQRDGGDYGVSNNCFYLSSDIVMYLPINIPSEGKKLKIEFSSNSNGYIKAGITYLTKGGFTYINDDGEEETAPSYDHYVGTYLYSDEFHAGANSTFEYTTSHVTDAKWILLYCTSGTVRMEDIAFMTD